MHYQNKIPRNNSTIEYLHLLKGAFYVIILFKMRNNILEKLRTPFGEAACLIAPFAIWMALLAFLPATAPSYAIRTGATALACLPALYRFRRTWAPLKARLSPLLWGLLGGLIVLALWVLPEYLPAPLANFYTQFCILGKAQAPTPSPYDPAVCGWFLTLTRLIGSAFIIAPVEELFFRRFLYRALLPRSVAPGTFQWSAFLLTAGLFALEHDRFVVAFVTGLIYGALALRKGLFAAIIAHITTNLLLGLGVIYWCQWQFW